jgi:hypothetical protein
MSVFPGLSPRNTVFEPKQVLVKFVLENVAFVRFFFGYFGFFLFW